MLAEVVVGRGLAGLDGAVLHGVGDLQARTISPAANARTWNLPSDISPTILANNSEPP
jgi:hypothetical protein